MNPGNERLDSLVKQEEGPWKYSFNHQITVGLGGNFRSCGGFSPLAVLPPLQSDDPLESLKLRGGRGAAQRKAGEVEQTAENSRFRTTRLDASRLVREQGRSFGCGMLQIIRNTMRLETMVDLRMTGRWKSQDPYLNRVSAGLP